MKDQLEQYCSICKAVGGMSGHRCSESTLRAINAANTRAINRDDSEESPRDFPARMFGTRISEAIEMVVGEYN